MVSLWLLVPFTQAELEMGILLEGCRGYLQGDGTSGFGERRTIVSRAGPLPILSLPFCPPFFALHILSFLLLPVLSFMFLWVHGSFSGSMVLSLVQVANLKWQHGAQCPTHNQLKTSVVQRQPGCSEARSDWLPLWQVFTLGPVGNRGWYWTNLKFLKESIL